MKTVYRGERFFREGEPFAIVRFSEANMANRVFHSHDFVEICYVCEGEGYHAVEDREYRVGKGDLFLINYDMAHAFYRGEEDGELVTYNLLFEPGFLDDSLLPFHDFSSLAMSYLFRSVWDDEPLRADLRLTFEEQREFESLIGKIMQEYTIRPVGCLAVIRALMIELIVKIMRGFHRKSATDPEQRRNAAVIEAAIRHLDDRYYEAISLGELARKAFLSKNYFASLFKETTGISVYQYVQQARIEQACRLMGGTDKPLGDIALEVGFSDYKAFYSAFRKQKGVSPHVYRSGAV
ncbi:MAG: transcriptional regulator, AraC family [Paenibacillus sp.]|jgi:AraC-like DNA-binding protein/quercetin dioxygenase-like cupin family protein|nr:transcriptional regulator, AraC family [Paenibacillus sp.]